MTAFLKTILILNTIFWLISSFCSLTHLEHPTPWLPQLWSGFKAPAFITRGKRFLQILEHRSNVDNTFYIAKFSGVVGCTKWWIWLPWISDLWEEWSSWLRRGILGGLSYKPSARESPKGNSEISPRRLPRLPKDWLGLPPGSDDETVPEKIWESSIWEWKWGSGWGSCLNNSQSCKSELGIFLLILICTMPWI